MKPADDLLRRRIVTLEGEIRDENANDLIARLLFLQSQSDDAPIFLHINSPGGAVVAGLAIVDAMEELRPPVHTRCTGLAHSMAAVILACGEPGHRSVARDAVVAFSLPWPVAAETLTEVERLSVLLMDIVTKATGALPAVVREAFCEGRPMSASDALKYGIVDRVEDR